MPGSRSRRCVSTARCAVLLAAAAVAAAIVPGPTAEAGWRPGEIAGHAAYRTIQYRVTPVDEMNPVMRHAYIVGIQEELQAHGYRPGPVDGVPGSRTTAAVRAYQRDAGLPVTGILSRELLDHMKFAEPKVYARDHRPAPVYDPSPVYGSAPAYAPAPGYAAPGPISDPRLVADVGLVEEVQMELNKRGYYRGPIDGREGTATRSAISQFQIDAGLPITGTADRVLLGQLYEAPDSLRRYN